MLHITSRWSLKVVKNNKCTGLWAGVLAIFIPQKNLVVYVGMIAVLAKLNALVS